MMLNYSEIWNSRHHGIPLPQLSACHGPTTALDSSRICQLCRQGYLLFTTQNQERCFIKRQSLTHESVQVTSQTQ